MDPELLSERLREAAESLGVEVRDSPSDADGAVVRLRGRTVAFVPAGALPQRKIEILADALSRLDTCRVVLVPEVREAIEKARGGHPGR